jgi:hypothetical protein
MKNADSPSLFSVDNSLPSCGGAGMGWAEWRGYLRCAWLAGALVLLLYAPALAQRKPPHKPWVNKIVQENSQMLDQLLRENLPEWAFLWDKPERYRLQILWTQVRRDRYNRPWVKHHSWRLDSTEYFFPASMVKLATAAVALEKLNVQREVGELSPHCPLTFEASPCTSALTRFARGPRQPGYGGLSHSSALCW